MEEKKMNLTGKNIWFVLRKPLYAVSILWILHFLTEIFGINRVPLGIYPRRLFGLKGIITAPLFHSDWGHLFNNSLPLLVLGAIMYFFYRKVTIPVVTLIYFLTGISVWAFAHQGFHIGASGVVYGIVSFVFWSGLFRRNTESIIMALIVVILYSGMIAGIFPEDPNISWESHLFGAIMGLITAVLFSGVDKPEKTNTPEQQRTHFFARDTFEKTIAQRKWEAEQEALRQQSQDNM